jgi:ankyrin repeat protein
MLRRITFLLWIVGLSVLAGCGGGMFTPSHHLTEEYNAAFAAASSGNLTDLRADVDKNPALLKSTEWDGRTLLHDAADKKQLEVVKYLLGKNVDVKAVTTDGRTALHMAAQHGDSPIVVLLLAHGANIDATDKKGWTPLDRAMKWGHADTAEYLRAHGAHQGKTPS